MKKISSPFIILIVIELMTAWICAPYSCEWGNSLYFYTGLIIAAISFVLPLLQKLWSIQKRIGIGLLFLVGSMLIWVVGFMLFNFRIMCRLF
ncbi:MAG: hypothetical protein QM802_25165 [Agriterribacter sp.]